jgi:hypothetical protein
MQKANQHEKKDCKNKNVVVKTERIEKNQKFLFWKLPHKKVIIIDKVLDSEKNIILRRKSISICSIDACDDRKFCRVKIVDHEIWIFEVDKDYEKSIIKRYDFCGNYLGQKDWTEELFYDH